MSDWLNRARTGPPHATGRFATREQLEDYVVAAWRAGNLQKDIAALRVRDQNHPSRRRG